MVKKSLYVHISHIIFLLKFKGERIIVYFILHVFWHSYTLCWYSAKNEPAAAIGYPCIFPQLHTINTWATAHSWD